MTIIMDKNLEAMVFCQFADKADFMCGVRREDGKVRSIGRIRFYTGDQKKDPFEDGDKKVWKQGTFETYEEAIEKITAMCNQLVVFSKLAGKESPKPEIYITERKGREDKEFLDEWSKQPFVHVKKLALH